MSVEPTYSVTTERLYARLPEFYRTLDEQVGWHLKTYLSAMVDELNAINLLMARLEYVPPEERAAYEETFDGYTREPQPDTLDYEQAEVYDNAYLYDGFAFPQPALGETSDLFDGRTADVDWLPYIGQMIGADILSLPTATERRDAVVRNYLGFRAGSRQALAEAARLTLTGEKYVRIYPHRNGAGSSITSIGTQWDILIVTKAEETPSVGGIVEEILRKGAKPAGVVLHHLTYSATWEIIETAFPTWTAIETNGVTWANIESGNADLLPVD